MIAGPALVTLAAVGVSLAISGPLMVTRRAVVAGILIGIGGMGMVLSAALHAIGSPPAGMMLALSAMLLVPLGVACYARAGWRHPVDFVALGTITTTGILATARWAVPQTVIAMGLVSACALIGQAWWRIETVPATERRRVSWLGLGLVVPGLIGSAVLYVTPTVDPAPAFGIYVLLGPAMYVGIARPEAVDVRGVVRKAVVYCVAAFVYLAGVVTLASLGELFTGSPLSLGAVAVIGLAMAVTLHPMRVLLEGLVDELLFGRRPDPLHAALHVAGQLGSGPELALEAVRQAMVLPYTAVLVDNVIVSASGDAVPHTRTVPLDLGEGVVGELVVGMRPGDLQLTQTDLQLLRILAPLLVQTLRAGALAADLQASREETVTAIQEERRRLRNDLHDGLGPRLTGIAFTSDAARNALPTDPSTADALLATLRQETATAIEDIRRLVYAMRPPALDELGLVPALRQQAQTMRTPAGIPLQVTISATDLPPTMSAAVEVAAYRIVVEALTNVCRHSGSDQADVRLRVVGDGLHIDVDDTGTRTGSWQPGVGLQSMRQRAAELGGTLTASGGQAGGRIRARLPLSPAPTPSHRIASASAV